MLMMLKMLNFGRHQRVDWVTNFRGADSPIVFTQQFRWSEHKNYQLPISESSD